jgi:hypothetical protein
MSETPDPRELAALDAIIAASLAGRKIEEVPDEELLARLETSPALSAEGRKLLETIGLSPFTQRSDDKSHAASRVTERPAGMYRLSSDDSIDPNLKREIEKKRQEILARLRASRNSDV